jgi:hypothetical protein
VRRFNERSILTDMHTHTQMLTHTHVLFFSQMNAIAVVQKIQWTCWRWQPASLTNKEQRIARQGLTLNMPHAAHEAPHDSSRAPATYVLSTAGSSKVPVRLPAKCQPLGGGQGGRGKGAPHPPQSPCAVWFALSTAPLPERRGTLLRRHCSAPHHPLEQSPAVRHAA